MLKLCDVTLRDGIQSLAKFPSTLQKHSILNKLIKSGIHHIEIGSNVSKKVQAMSDIVPFLEGFEKNKKQITNKQWVQTEEAYKFIFPSVLSNLKVLVPTKEKMIELLPYYKRNVFQTYSLITSASESFSQKNTRMSVKQSLYQIDDMLYSHEGYNYDTHSHPNFRVYISTCFGCPIEGKLNKEHLSNIDHILDRYQSIEHVREIVISDTIGVFDKSILKQIMYGVEDKTKIWLHLHVDPIKIKKTMDDCLSLGIFNYDVSLGHLGGCSSLEKKVFPNLHTLSLLENFDLSVDKKILQNTEIDLLNHL